MSSRRSTPAEAKRPAWCVSSTRAVALGEDFRAGRWWWENEDAKECGLHVNPNQPAQEISA